MFSVQMFSYSLSCFFIGSEKETGKLVFFVYLFILCFSKMYIDKFVVVPTFQKSPTSPHFLLQVPKTDKTNTEFNIIVLKQTYSMCLLNV